MPANHSSFPSACFTLFVRVFHVCIWWLILSFEFTIVLSVADSRGTVSFNRIIVARIFLRHLRHCWDTQINCTRKRLASCRNPYFTHDRFRYLWQYIFLSGNRYRCVQSGEELYRGRYTYDKQNFHSVLAVKKICVSILL